MAANEAQLRAECERLMRVNSGLQTEMVMNYVPTADVHHARSAIAPEPPCAAPEHSAQSAFRTPSRSLVPTAMLAGSGS